MILALGSEKLIKIMTTAKEQTVRRQATAYIGTLAQNGDKTVGRLARALSVASGTTYGASDLPFNSFEFSNNERSISFSVDGRLESL